MARYEPVPSSPLKFRTAGFPQSGFKAGLSDSAFPISIAVKPHTRHTLERYWFASTLRAFRRTLRLPLCVGSYSALHTHRHEHGRLCRVTPGVLAQVGVVVFPPSLLNQPHGPHLRAQGNFSVIALYALPCYCGLCVSRPQVIPRFHLRSFVACRSLRPRRAQPLHISSSFVACAGLRRDGIGSALSTLSISGLTD